MHHSHPTITRRLWLVAVCLLALLLAPSVAMAIGRATPEQMKKLAAEKGDEMLADPVANRQRIEAIRPLAFAPQADSVATTANDGTITAKCGSGAVTATARVYQVSSVSAVKSEIAAGALASAPHQTEIHIQVSPVGAVPVAVWLTGRRGHAVGAPQTYAGHRQRWLQERG